MDYTLSNSYATDAGTGFRKHLQAQAVPTAVSDLDINSIIWSLMEVLKGSGLSGVQFDPINPATYQRLALAIRSAGVRFSAFGSISGTYALTLSDLTKIIAVQANGQTITLPPVTDSHIGYVQRLFIYPGSSSFVNIQASAGSQISTVATLGLTTAVSADGYADFIWEGSGSQHWQASGMGLLGKGPSFGASLASSGYQKLPSGLILQWGAVNPPSANTQAGYSYPIAFTSVLSFSCSSVNSGTSFVGVNGYSVSNTAFSVMAQNAGNSVSWFAIGK